VTEILNLTKYVLRRAIFGIVVILSVMTITFILSHSIGGNLLVAWLGRSAYLHPALAKAYAIKYHLNDPWYVQYYYYVIGLLQGNMGYSPSRGFIPVATIISETLPYTLQLVFFAFVGSMILGIALGIIAARHNHTSIDTGIRVTYLAFYSSPAFFVAIALLILFGFVFHLLPSAGAYDPALSQPTPITGLPLVDSLLEQNWSYFFSAVQHVILPSLAMTLVTFGVVTRLLRNSLLDVMSANYIRTARAKGVKEGNVVYIHALRNALIPIVTLSSLIITWLITSTIFV